MPNSEEYLAKIFYQGLDLFFEQKYTDALDIFESLLATPQVTPTLLLQIYRRKGDCLTELGRFDEALISLDKAWELSANEPQFQVWIAESKGSCLWKMGQFEQAFQYYDQALNLVTDKDALEYLESEYERLVDDYEWNQKHGDFEAHKTMFRSGMKQRIAQINKKKDNADTDETLLDKPVLEA